MIKHLGRFVKSKVAQDHTPVAAVATHAEARTGAAGLVVVYRFEVNDVPLTGLRLGRHGVVQPAKTVDPLTAEDERL